MPRLELWQLLALIVVALVVYFIPSIVAYAREHHNRLAILVLNTFLGWSFLGWVAALVWAATHVQRDDPLARSQVIRREPTLEDTTDRQLG
jgi:alpha/beta superfamily hydrolase